MILISFVHTNGALDIVILISFVHTNQGATTMLAQGFRPLTPFPCLSHGRRALSRRAPCLCAPRPSAASADTAWLPFVPPLRGRVRTLRVQLTRPTNGNGGRHSRFAHCGSIQTRCPARSKARTNSLASSCVARHGPQARAPSPVYLCVAWHGRRLVPPRKRPQRLLRNIAPSVFAAAAKLASIRRLWRRARARTRMPEGRPRG